MEQVNLKIYRYSSTVAKQVHIDVPGTLQSVLLPRAQSHELKNAK